MKILYLSCHEILEYDELKLFAEMGHEVYSLGAYTFPGGDDNRKRPPLKLPYDAHFIELAMQYRQEGLHPEQLEGMDAVIIMHRPDYVVNNWTLFKEFIAKGGRVIWRSIGQSVPHVERQLSTPRMEGLEIVRYSLAEQTIAGNVGQDAVIYFYKDPEEFGTWNGANEVAINFTQSMRERGQFCGFEITRRVMASLPFKLYGPGNDDLPEWNGGLLEYHEQKNVLRNSRVYYYHGTYPASYTLSFIEAMMTGIPMVCVGPSFGNGPMFPQQQTYEIPAIIENGHSGFYSDDIQTLRQHIKDLISDRLYAQRIGEQGRRRAIEIFGKEKVKEAWQAFLGGNENQK